MGDIEIHGNKIKLLKGQKTTLVMLSGGIDSLYTLVKLLKETDDQILVHHIHMINDETRHLIEAESARKIVDWCKRNYREFSYSESGIDHRGFNFAGFDMVTVGFEAGIVIHSYQLAKKAPVHRWMAGICAEEKPVEGRKPHVEASCAANCFPYQAPPLEVLPVVSKAAEIGYIPDELIELASICRYPVKTKDGYEECGRCTACEAIHKAWKNPATIS